MKDQWQWWYLSYADDAGFRGGAVVYARTPEEAARQSRAVGLSPGGETLIIPIPPAEVPDRGYRNRRLTEDDVRACWTDVKTAGELKGEGLN